eukprot:7977942-Ditylum_brightwellii.AAC.1
MDNFKFFNGAKVCQSNRTREGKEFAKQARKELAIGSVQYNLDLDKLMGSEGTETNSDLSNGNNNEVDDAIVPV